MKQAITKFPLKMWTIIALGVYGLILAVEVTEIVSYLKRSQIFNQIASSGTIIKSSISDDVSRASSLGQLHNYLYIIAAVTLYIWIRQLNRTASTLRSTGIISSHGPSQSFSSFAFIKYLHPIKFNDEIEHGTAAADKDVSGRAQTVGLIIMEVLWFVLLLASILLRRQATGQMSSTFSSFNNQAHNSAGAVQSMGAQIVFWNKFLIAGHIVLLFWVLMTIVIIGKIYSRFSEAVSIMSESDVVITPGVPREPKTVIRSSREKVLMMIAAVLMIPFGLLLIAVGISNGYLFALAGLSVLFAALVFCKQCFSRNSQSNLPKPQ